MKQDLGSIANFGAIDADADELLERCFETHRAYLDVLNLQKFLVLGRKGAGKTAIYRRLLGGQSSEFLAIGNSFDDYPWHHHNLQAQVGVPEERRFVHSWKYLILIGLARLVLNRDDSQPWRDSVVDDLTAVENFVVDSYGSADPALDRLFAPGQKLHLSGDIGIPSVMKLTVDSVTVEDLPRHVQDVNAALQERLIRALNPERKYFVCFDQLDLGYSVSDPAYDQRLIGLLIAAKQLFEAARDGGRSLAPVVFLRDDIYEDVSFEDKNKITENYSNLVVWSESGDFALKGLMERRFTEVLADDDQAVPWDEVFDEAKEMPGRQSKYKHLCDRTFLRPRDLIKFCNEVLVAYKRRGGGGTFENDDIHQAREVYSKYLLKELDDEIKKHLPLYKEYLEAIKAVGYEKFTLEQFKMEFGARPKLADADAFEALEGLFDFSVISFLKPGGRGGGSEYVWRYKDPGARFNRSVESYRVHPGFREALDLTAQAKSAQGAVAEAPVKPEGR